MHCINMVDGIGRLYLNVCCNLLKAVANVDVRSRQKITVRVRMCKVMTVLL